MDSDADEHDSPADLDTATPATNEEEEDVEIATPNAEDTTVAIETEDGEVPEDTEPEATPAEASEENIAKEPADDSITQSSETIAPEKSTDTTIAPPPDLPKGESTEANNDDIQMEPAPSQEEGELSPGISESKESDNVATEDQEEEEEVSLTEHIDQELDSLQIGNEVDADGEPINADTYRPSHFVSGHLNSLASIFAEIPNVEIDYMGGLERFPGAFIITPCVLWFLRIILLKLRYLYVSRKESKTGKELTTPETLTMEINHTNRRGRSSTGKFSSIKTNTHHEMSDETNKIETPKTKTRKTRGSSASKKEAQSTPRPRTKRMVANLAPFNNDGIKKTRKTLTTQSSNKSPRKKRKTETPKTKTPKTKSSLASKKEAQSTPRPRGKRMLSNLAPFNNYGIKEPGLRTSKRSRDKKEAQESQGRSLRKRLN